MTRPGRQKIVALTALIAVLTLGIAGAAYGYWRASGSGSGTGSTGTTVAVTLGPGVPSGSLYPGGQANVVLTVTNTNAVNVSISSLSLNTTQGTNGFSVDAGHASCSVAALTFATQTNGGTGWTVPARVGAVNGTLPITLPNALAMSTSAADACQGATFTVYLAAG